MSTRPRQQRQAQKSGARAAKKEQRAVTHAGAQRGGRSCRESALRIGCRLAGVGQLPGLARLHLLPPTGVAFLLDVSLGCPAPCLRRR